MDNNIYIKNNGITIAIQKWKDFKKPVLAVYVEEENCWYKVASFNSEDSASRLVRSFMKLMELDTEGE